MAVGYRSSSSTGVGDSFVSSVDVPVPSGAAAGDIAILAIEQWESTNPAVTWPPGFTQIVNHVSGSQKLKASWKRLTAGDTGNYTVSWTGSQWTIGHCTLITGGLASGDPIEATNTATSESGTTIPSTSVTVASAAFLSHLTANEDAALATPPTSFTEVQDSNYLHTNYRIPDTSGGYTASGGTLSASTLSLAALIAIKPAASEATTVIEQPAETDTATTVTRTKRVLIEQAIETSTATAPTRRKSRPVGQPAETNLAQTVTVKNPNQPVVIGQAVENPTATSLVRVKQHTLAVAEVLTTALPVTRLKAKTLAEAVEVDSAFPMALGAGATAVAPRLTIRPNRATATARPNSSTMTIQPNGVTLTIGEP